MSAEATVTAASIRNYAISGLTLHRMRGSHQIYRNGNSETIVINNKLNAMVAKRLVKEFNLQ